VTPVAVGQFAVIAGYGGILLPGIRHITKVTAKMVFFERWSTEGRAPITDILVAFDSEEDAQRLVNKLEGIRGEQNRRVIAAREAASKAANAAIASARQGETK